MGFQLSHLSRPTVAPTAAHDGCDIMLTKQIGPEARGLQTVPLFRPAVCVSEVFRRCIGEIVAFDVSSVNVTPAARDHSLSN